MNRKLINYIKETPPVYCKSSKAFWDDEHISKSMLEGIYDDVKGTRFTGQAESMCGVFKA